MIRHFSKTVYEAAMKHAIAEHPKESVGVVVGGRYKKLTNTAENPTEAFMVDMAEYVSVVGEKTAQAVIHSHPDGPKYPSGADMVAQVKLQVPFGIVWTNGVEADYPFFWGDGLTKEELIGREFKHGVTDCYSIIRDYYQMELGITLMEFPRDWDWWNVPSECGTNLYEDHFQEAGFTPLIDGEQPQKGDVFLASIMATKANHGGIYLGDGTILHHLQNRLSRREPMSGWRKYIKFWLRYRGQ